MSGWLSGGIEFSGGQVYSNKPINSDEQCSLNDYEIDKCVFNADEADY